MCAFCFVEHVVFYVWEGMNLMSRNHIGLWRPYTVCYGKIVLYFLWRFSVSQRQTVILLFSFGHWKKSFSAVLSSLETFQGFVC